MALGGSSRSPTVVMWSPLGPWDQDRLRRNEKRTTEREEFREKWAERRKHLGRSGRVVAQRTKRAKIAPCYQWFAGGFKRASPPRNRRSSGTRDDDFNPMLGSASAGPGRNGFVASAR